MGNYTFCSGRGSLGQSAPWYLCSSKNREFWTLCWRSSSVQLPKSTERIHDTDVAAAQQVHIKKAWSGFTRWHFVKSHANQIFYPMETQHLSIAQLKAASKVNSPFLCFLDPDEKSNRSRTTPAPPPQGTLSFYRVTISLDNFMAISWLGSRGAGYLSTCLHLGVDPSVTPTIASCILINASSEKTQDKMHLTSSAWGEFEWLIYAKEKGALLTSLKIQYLLLTVCLMQPVSKKKENSVSFSE